MRNRAAFTLVETLVALLLFQFAMLALAAGAAIAARDLATARRVQQAHDTARNRVARLATVGCPVPTAGTAAIDALVEHWRIEAIDRRRFISDSVTFRKSSGREGFVVARGAVLCPA